MRSLFLLIFLLIGSLGLTQSHSFITHDSIQITYDDEGTGAVVVLLHGFINSRKSWGRAELKKDLLSKGFRVIVPDLRGNGDSDKPHEEKYWKNKNEVKDVIFLIDLLEIESYLLVGYSRGSTVAAELVTLDKRVSKVVLGGMGAEFTDPTWEIPGIFADAFAGRIPLSEMTEGAVNYAKSIDADLICMSLQQKYQPSPNKTSLGKIDIPVLVIAGNEDNAINKTSSLSFVFNNAIINIVTGDHNNTYKQSNFSAAVIAFLN